MLSYRLNTILEFLSLTGGCIGSSESALVKMPHCWKSHVTTHLKYEGSVHDIRYLSHYTQMHLINSANVFSKARGLNFSLHLYLDTSVIYVSIKASGESGHRRRLAWAFASPRCAKYKIS